VDSDKVFLAAEFIVVVNTLRSLKRLYLNHLQNLTVEHIRSILQAIVVDNPARTIEHLEIHDVYLYCHEVLCQRLVDHALLLVANQSVPLALVLRTTDKR